MVTLPWYDRYYKIDDRDAGTDAVFQLGKDGTIVEVTTWIKRQPPIPAVIVQVPNTEGRRVVVIPEVLSL